jgi:hypothetical protein
MTLDQVQERTGIQAAKLSRIETAYVGVKPADLDVLLDAYHVVDEGENMGKREMLRRLAREGARRGWWQTYRDSITPAYADLISLEAEASSVSTYQASLIPGLLQTAAYARAVISAVNWTSTQEQVSALVEVRQARQAVLTRPDPLTLWAIIHEAALRPNIASPTVMRDQLQRLLDLRDLPHVEIQVLPMDAAPHPGLAGSFAVMGFPESADLDVVLLESLTSTLWVEEAEEVSVYRGAFERLRAAALPLDASSDLIRKAKDKL